MKGFLTNPEAGLLLKFQFNPIQIEWDKRIDYEIESVGGWPAPIVTWVSGGDKRIRFELFFDRSKSGKASGAWTVDMPGIGVQGALAVIESFLYPQEGPFEFRNALTGEQRFVAPPDCYLILGTRWARCKLLSAPIKESMFDSALVPIRATVTLEFLVLEEGALAMVDHIKRKVFAGLGSTLGNL